MYYSADKTKEFSNRHDALDYGSRILFDFYDAEFYFVDWKHEPSQSLETLYRERAQQLRDQYDNIILAYSGGIDSSTILETFYYNNIHIDEIMMVGAFSQDSHTGSDENHNAELTASGFEILKKLDLPNTKITTIDYMSRNYSLFDKNSLKILKDHGTDWVKHIGTHYSVHHWAWYDIARLLNIDPSKKNALIFGNDKPVFGWDSNYRTYTVFKDTEMFSYAFASPSPGLDKIRFYTSLDTIDLMRKQLHIVRRFFMKNIVEEKTMREEDFKAHLIPIIEKLIYNLKHPLLFKSKKTISSIMSPRDRFMIKNRNTPIYKVWQDGIRKISKFEMRNPLTHSIESKRYYLD